MHNKNDEVAPDPGPPMLYPTIELIVNDFLEDCRRRKLKAVQAEELMERVLNKVMADRFPAIREALREILFEEYIDLRKEVDF